MLPRFNFARLLCFVLLVGAFLALGVDHVEAKEGLASWYGPGPQGRTTASGQPYDPNAYTTAHRTLPFGTQLRVNYRGRSVPVTVNDRGPYTGNRELDLSQAAARDLGLIPDGVGYVDYDIPGNPEDLSWRAPQQTGLTRGVAQSDPMQGTAQQPYPSQGRAQQPASLYLVESQPIPAQGAAQLPEFARDRSNRWISRRGQRNSRHLHGIPHKCRSLRRRRRMCRCLHRSGLIPRCSR